jgi:hypothetical protein
MINDYSMTILTEQRRQDLMAEAANERLAKLATADRTPWWRRAGHALVPSRQHVLTPRHSTR